MRPPSQSSPENVSQHTHLNSGFSHYRCFIWVSTFGRLSSLCCGPLLSCKDRNRTGIKVLVSIFNFLITVLLTIVLKSVFRFRFLKRLLIFLLLQQSKCFTHSSFFFPSLFLCSHIVFRELNTRYSLGTEERKHKASWPSLYFLMISGFRTRWKMSSDQRSLSAKLFRTMRAIANTWGDHNFRLSGKIFSFLSLSWGGLSIPSKKY